MDDEEKLEEVSDSILEMLKKLEEVEIQFLMYGTTIDTIEFTRNFRDDLKELYNLCINV